MTMETHERVWSKERTWSGLCTGYTSVVQDKLEEQAFLQKNTKVDPKRFCR